MLMDVTQSLAGRVGMLALLPFTLGEMRQADIAPDTVDGWLLSGSYPPIYDRPVDLTLWHGSYVQTYLERDVRQLLAMRDLSQCKLFETAVVTELIEARWNRGLASNISFWRDRGGRKVDVIVDNAGNLEPIEIKSGATLHRSAFTGLTRWCELAGGETSQPN
jgi:predicted AAA+ superfamily ATPase